MRRKGGWGRKAKKLAEVQMGKVHMAKRHRPARKLDSGFLAGVALATGCNAVKYGLASFMVSRLEVLVWPTECGYGSRTLIGRLPLCKRPRCPLLSRTLSDRPRVARGVG
jgi:hypothetical protein